MARLRSLMWPELKPSWICAQLGAREHYSVPRALYRRNRLAALATDLWQPPRRRFLLNGARLKARYATDMNGATVASFDWRGLWHEAVNRATGIRGWELIERRNNWFQESAIRWLKQTQASRGETVFFTYSYAARRLLKFARDRGWKTVLGQIDPAIVEEQIVSAEVQRSRLQGCDWSPAPPAYWDSWRAETELADLILVNSPWSARALVQAGVSSEKLRVVPLAYSHPSETAAFSRTYPQRFDASRPLNVLFLGHVIVRKGAHYVAEAARTMIDRPVHFFLVGDCRETRSLFRELPNVTLTEAIPRAAVHDYYRQADVFLFPTLSDGFGLTQLEARAWRLPLLCSDRCGEVVEDERNGLLLRNVSRDSIVAALERCLSSPSDLAEWSSYEDDQDRFTLESLGDSLLEIERELLGEPEPANR